jgi:hypothetical protein
MNNIQHTDIAIFVMAVSSVIDTLITIVEKFV